MKTITYTNNQGLELKINKFTSGQFKWAFSLTFNNGAHTFCYTMTELRTILLKNGMTRKWAANVKDRFDPLTEEHVLINRYRTPGGSEMEVFITSRIPFVNMVGTGLDMGYMKFQLLGYDSVIIVVRFGVRICREVPVEFFFHVLLFVNSILTADVCFASLEAHADEKSLSFG